MPPKTTLGHRRRASALFCGDRQGVRGGGEGWCADSPPPFLFLLRPWGKRGFSSPYECFTKKLLRVAHFRLDIPQRKKYTLALVLYVPPFKQLSPLFLTKIVSPP